MRKNRNDSLSLNDSLEACFETPVVRNSSTLFSREVYHKNQRKVSTVVVKYALLTVRNPFLNRIHNNPSSAPASANITHICSWRTDSRDLTFESFSSHLEFFSKVKQSCIFTYPSKHISHLSLRNVSKSRVPLQISIVGRLRCRKVLFSCQIC